MGTLNEVTVKGVIVHTAMDAEQFQVGVLQSGEDYIPFRSASPDLKKGQPVILQGHFRGLREMLDGTPKIRSFLEVVQCFPLADSTGPSTLLHPQDPGPAPQRPPEPLPDISAENPGDEVFQGPEQPWSEE